jgi:hypothetical protein
MSTDESEETPDIPQVDGRKPLWAYEGRDKYIDWIDDYLGITLTEPQKKIVHSIMDNQRTLIVAGNGFGKSYCLAAFSLAFLMVNYPTSIMVTSGTYNKLMRTFCRPIEKMHQDAEGLPGRYLRSKPTGIVFRDNPDHFLEAASPRDPGELEGVHNKHTLGVVEEADKSAVGEGIFDSLESLLTDDNDKLVAVANPPKDENNVVYDLMKDDAWKVLQFSSFDSYNVRLERNHDDPYQRDEDGDVIEDKSGYPKLKSEVEDKIISELVTLKQIRNDWISWNDRPWPGIDEAEASSSMDGLDIRWYRRRLGVISPASAQVLRPFTVEDVEEAFNRDPAQTTITPDGLGWDVVRGSGKTGDFNAFCGIFGRDLLVLNYWRGDGGHIENEAIMKDELESSWSAPLAVDTVGVGSESGERINEFYPHVIRFNAGSGAEDHLTYTDKWTEGLCILGDILRDGAGFNHNKLREELLACARCVQLEEKYSSKYDTTRFTATQKTDLSQFLGRSPDLLDGMYQAVWASETSGSSSRTISSTW